MMVMVLRGEGEECWDARAVAQRQLNHQFFHPIFLNQAAFLLRILNIPTPSASLSLSISKHC